LECVCLCLFLFCTVRPSKRERERKKETNEGRVKETCSVFFVCKKVLTQTRKKNRKSKIEIQKRKINKKSTAMSSSATKKEKKASAELHAVVAPALVAAIGAASAALFTLVLKQKIKEDELARPWLREENCVSIDDLAALKRKASTSTSASRSSSSSSSRRRSPLVVADLSGKSLREIHLAELEGVTFAKLRGNGGLELVVAPPPRRLALAALRSLDLSRCSLRDVPEGLASACPNLRDLDLSHNELKGSLGTSKGGREKSPPFPPSLLRLNSQGNRGLRSVDGDALSALPNLVLLGLKSCSLESLPGEIGKLKRLRELYVTDNKLRHLPREIGACESLVKLQASFNEFESLPLEELAKLPKLEMARFAACRISELKGLEEIVFGSARSPSPSSVPFRSLCWVSLAGNPVFERHVPPPRTEAARVFYLDDVVVQKSEGGGGGGGEEEEEVEAAEEEEGEEEERNYDATPHTPASASSPPLPWQARPRCHWT
jgi:Leucine-rich repeat (LRR) protein